MKDFFAEVVGKTDAVMYVRPISACPLLLPNSSSVFRPHACEVD